MVESIGYLVLLIVVKDVLSNRLPCSLRSTLVFNGSHGLGNACFVMLGTDREVCVGSPFIDQHVSFTWGFACQETDICHVIGYVK
jgi:hypothetical protein